MRILVRKPGSKIDTCMSKVLKPHGPIKPVTTQFAVGRNRSLTVIRKQFPLRPAAAKTIHRSQGDTETQIVVNLDTKKAIPHIHV